MKNNYKRRGLKTCFKDSSKKKKTCLRNVPKKFQKFQSKFIEITHNLIYSKGTKQNLEANGPYTKEPKVGLND